MTTPTQRTPHIGEIVHYVTVKGDKPSEGIEILPDDIVHSAAMILSLNGAGDPDELGVFSTWGYWYVVNYEGIEHSDFHALYTWHWPEHEAPAANP
jgi:hypothetical protein